VLIGVVAVAVVAGGGFYAAYAFTQNAIDTPQKSALPTLPSPIQNQPTQAPATDAPTDSPTPDATTAAPPAGVFSDDALRRFAGRVADNPDRCKSLDPGTLANVTEAVTCQFDNGFTVRYLKFSDTDSRDSYTGRVRKGLDGQLDVKRNSFWSSGGKRQGRIVEGSQNDGNTQYIYWNVFNDAVSGELLAQTDNRRDAERFWRNQL
jgi:hypothetical protein